MSDFLTQTISDLPRVIVVVGEEEVFQALVRTPLVIPGLEIEVVPENEWQAVADPQQVWRWVWITDLVELAVEPSWLEWLFQVGERARIVVFKLPGLSEVEEPEWWRARRELAEENLKKIRSYLRQASIIEVINPETNIQWWWGAWVSSTSHQIRVVGEGIGFVSLTGALTNVLSSPRGARSQVVKSFQPDWLTIGELFVRSQPLWHLSVAKTKRSAEEPLKNSPEERWYSADPAQLAAVLKIWASSIVMKDDEEAKPALLEKKNPNNRAEPTKILFQAGRRGQQKTPTFNFLTKHPVASVRVTPRGTAKFSPIYVPKITNTFLRSNQWQVSQQQKAKQFQKTHHLRTQLLERSKQPISESVAVPAPEMAELESELRQVLQWSRVNQKSSELRQTVKKRTIIKKKNQRKKWFVGVFVGVAGIFGGLSIIVGLFLIAQYRVWQDIALFTNKSQLGAHTQLLRSLQLMEGQLSVYEKILPLDWVESSQYLTHVARALATYTETQAQLHDQVLEVLSKVLKSGETTITEQNTQKLVQTIQALQNTGSMVVGYLDQPPVGFADADIQALKKLRQTLAAERLTNQRWELLAEELPKFLGLQQRRVYVVAITDDLNHRTGGGEVVGLGLLVLSQGKVVDAQFLPASDVEQRLVGEVKAPIEITEVYPEQSNWRLVDALVGWQGAQNAYVVRQYVENSIGVRPDAVILLPLDVLAEFLKSSGGITVGQTQPVLAEQLLERVKLVGVVQTNSDSFLLPLVAGWWQQWQNTSQIEVLAAFDRALQDQRAWVVPTDPNEFKKFQELGVVGGLIQPPCPAQLASTRCVSMTRQWSETNVTRNSLSASMNRQSSEIVKVTPTGVQHQVSYQVTNTEPPTSGVRGEYRAMAEWLLPRTATEVSILVDGTAPTGLIIRLDEKTQKMIVRAPYTVLPTQTKTVQLSYQTPETLGDTSLVLGWQTTPGMPSWKHLVKVSFEGVTSTALIPPAKMEGQQFQYLFPTNTPFVMATRLQESSTRPVVQ